ncbi:hypothetical protein [Neorhizobium sp. DT-125]|uniref:hypothetical protein n=1 Tax=Neorhizobium sp. DT-125 TaxID=3396163 RepID=UPI003F1D4FC2
MSSSTRTEPHETAHDDPRLAFVYQEAVRGLQHQQQVVESLNARGGNLIFATAFATSLLGTKALGDGVGPWDWTALLLLFLIGCLAAFVLWPHYNYTFRFDPEELLALYVDQEGAMNMPAIHRALALRIKADMGSNWRVIQRIRIALEIALVALLFEILAWLISIGVTPQGP